MTSTLDPYYLRPEVSNSDLTALKELLHPRQQFPGRDQAFRLGSLVDAMVTEPSRVNFYTLTLDGSITFPDDTFRLAREMVASLRAHARSDRFLDFTLRNAQTQHVMINPDQRFTYSDFPFTLSTRCKWDWWLGTFGGDLKTTAATSQKEFDDMIDFFDWDRSRAWYMDIAHSDHDFIYAISKQNLRVFSKKISRQSAIYRRGRDKYLYLAFQYWCLNLVP